MVRFVFAALFVFLITVSAPPVVADGFVVRDKHGRTAFTLESYPVGKQKIIRDRNGRTRFIVRPDPYGGHRLDNVDGRTRGRLNFGSKSDGRFKKEWSKR